MTDVTEKRSDDRDSKKSLDEATDDPWQANKTNEGEQAAELQVGEDSEREDLSRFEPDPRAERSYPDPSHSEADRPAEPKGKDSDPEP